VKKFWTHRDIDAPAEALWDLLTDPQRWADWGPTVVRAELRSEQFEEGATGIVTTFVGVDVNFEVTAYDDGVSWAWKIAGVTATDHTVEPLGADRCRVGFGVPWAAAPYLSVCQLALQRLEQIATQEKIIP
jgi:uncharacterized protein YndB with AHSA1/START domain